MSLESDLVCLKTIPLFLSLPPARLKLVALMGEKLHYDAGTVIIEEGEKPDGVHFLLDGKIELSHRTAEGEQKSFIFESGSIIGDVSMLCDRAYIGRVSAKTEVNTLRLPQQLFFELLETIPEFALALSRDLASRLYRLGAAVLHQERLH